MLRNIENWAEWTGLRFVHLFICSLVLSLTGDFTPWGEREKEKLITRKKNNPASRCPDTRSEPSLQWWQASVWPTTLPSAPKWKAEGSRPLNSTSKSVYIMRKLFISVATSNSYNYTGNSGAKWTRLWHQKVTRKAQGITNRCQRVTNSGTRATQGDEGWFVCGRTRWGRYPLPLCTTSSGKHAKFG